MCETCTHCPLCERKKQDIVKTFLVSVATHLSGITAFRFSQFNLILVPLLNPTRIKFTSLKTCVGSDWVSITRIFCAVTTFASPYCVYLRNPQTLRSSSITGTNHKERTLANALKLASKGTQLLVPEVSTLFTQ